MITCDYCVMTTFFLPLILNDQTIKDTVREIKRKRAIVCVCARASLGVWFRSVESKNCTGQCFRVYFLLQISGRPTFEISARINIVWLAVKYEAIKFRESGESIEESQLIHCQFDKKKTTRNYYSIKNPIPIRIVVRFRISSKKSSFKRSSIMSFKTTKSDPSMFTTFKMIFIAQTPHPTTHITQIGFVNEANELPQQFQFQTFIF